MFPLSPPPVADIGAWTWPRMLQKWLDVNPVTKLTRTSTYITLPAFVQGSNTWNGYSDIVESFNFEGPNNMSLTGITGNIPTNPNYTLCVSYQVNGVVTRYLIWLANGSNMNQDLVQYTNQPLLKNFRLEVWNTNQGVASQSGSINFYTSVLGLYDYRWATDSVLVAPDAPCINFNTNSFSAFAASPPTTNLVGWFNADHLNGNTGGSQSAAGAVATWKSCTVQGILGYDVLSNTVGTPPTCINSDADFNGHNSVSFPDFTNIATLTSPGAPSGSSLLFNSVFTAGSIIIAVMKSLYAGTTAYGLLTIAQYSNGVGWSITNASVANAIRILEAGGPSNYDQTIPSDLNQSCLAAYITTGLVETYSMQNQTWFDGYYASPITYTMNGWFLTDTLWKCAEILVYTSLATPADAQQLLNYLTTRYGTSTNLFKLPLNFPATAVSKTN